MADTVVGVRGTRRVTMFVRSFEIDAGTRVAVAAVFLFLLGFLSMPFGSMATFLFVFLGLASVVGVARRKIAIEIPPPVGFAITACLFYFAVDLLSPVLYADRADGWMPIVASLHFLLFPVLFTAFRPAKVDPVAAFVIGARVGAILGGIIAVFEILDGVDRATGGSVSSFPFGATAAWLTVISLISTGRHGWRERLFVGVAFAGGLVAAILSESRGVWLAFPVLMIVSLVYFKVRYGTRLTLMATAALTLLGVSVLIAAGDSIRERFEETLVMFQGFEFGQGEDDAFSLDQRALMLHYGIEAIAERPLIGYGPQNAVEEVRARAAAEGYTIEEYNHLHNEFLTETVGNGVLGLVSLLLLLAAPLVVAYRSVRDDRFPDRVALAWFASSGAAVFGLTTLSFGNDITNTVFASVLLVICLSAASGAEARAGKVGRSA